LVGEGCFFRAVDDLEWQAGLASRPVQEELSIRGSATGFRCDGPHAFCPAIAQFASANRQGGEGAIHCVLAQASTILQALSKAHDTGKGVYDAESGATAAGDEETAVVGAEIQRGIDPGQPLIRSGAV